MNSKIFEGESKADRHALLKDNAEHTEELSYSRQLTTEEINELNRQYAQTSVAILEIEEEKKEAINEFKERLKPLLSENTDRLSVIKAGAVNEKKNCYVIFDHESNMAGYYDEDGLLRYQRPLKPDEKQQRVRFLTGTNS